jgi:hypothetical protein
MTKKFNNSLGLVFDKLGLVLSPVICKLLGCLHQAAEQGLMIPCALLKGVPGAGKTSTAEAFALAVNASKFFYQCNPGTGFDQLIGQPNLGAVLRQDAAACISDGILIQAAKAAMAGEDVVLILDEIDKTSPEVDAYLLDFLQSRRIHDSNMEELVVPSDVKFWVFLTSNDERELSDALMRRVRRITVDRPSRSTVANVLGIQEDAALLDVWDLTEKLAISQLRSYLEDGGDPQDLDLDILSQYVDDLPDLSTLGEQNTDTEPAVIRIDVTETDLITEIKSFKWFPYNNTEILIEVATLSELVRLQEKLLQKGTEINEFPYSTTKDDHRMIIDLIDPVISNQDGGIFAIPSTDGVITIIARRDATGTYYLSGNELRSLRREFFSALPSIANI